MTDTHENLSSAEPTRMGRKLVRTYSAGVFLATIESRNGKEATLRNARRIWYWAGAATLSELAVTGTKSPGSCKFPCEVDQIVVTEVIEILDCTPAALQSIDAVPLWTA
jgi:hypothetical protein